MNYSLFITSYKVAGGINVLAGSLYNLAGVLNIIAGSLNIIAGVINIIAGSLYNLAGIINIFAGVINIFAGGLNETADACFTSAVGLNSFLVYKSKGEVRNLLIFIAGCSKGGLDISLDIGGEINEAGEWVVEDLVPGSTGSVELEVGANDGSVGSFELCVECFDRVEF